MKRILGWSRWPIVALAVVLCAVSADARAGDAPSKGQLTFLDHRGAPLEPSSGGVITVATSNLMPDDPSLPRGPALWAHASDPDVFRLEAYGAGAHGDIAYLDVCVGPNAGGPWDERACRGGLRGLPCVRVEADRYRCPFLRLVTDRVDAESAEAEGHLLFAALGDYVRARWTDGAFLDGTARVGRRDEKGVAQPVLRGRARVHVLRLYAGGPPSAGGPEAGALALVRKQLPVVNERWAQCGVWYGTEDDLPIAFVDPPGPALLSVADQTGAVAGGGRIHFQVDGQPIGPLDIAPGSPPAETARRVAAAIRTAGFRTAVTPNPPVTGRPLGSVDVLVRRPNGELAEIAPIGDAFLTTDRQQSLSIGRVDLSNGLDKFGSHNANSGTLEERTMFKALSDDDPATVEVFIVNRFAIHPALAETFIEDDQGPFPNLILITERGLVKGRASFTMPHELGHILLDEPGHPDSERRDTPHRLMDSDASGASPRGPKRLLPAECMRTLAESGPDATPPLLQPVSWAELVPAPVEERAIFGYPPGHRWPAMVAKRSNNNRTHEGSPPEGRSPKGRSNDNGGRR